VRLGLAKYTLQGQKQGKHKDCLAWHRHANLIAVSSRLVRFAFCKTKSQAIIFPRDVEKMSMNNAL
jgi:hypothetical protein